MVPQEVGSADAKVVLLVFPRRLAPKEVGSLVLPMRLARQEVGSSDAAASIVLVRKVVLLLVLLLVLIRAPLAVVPPVAKILEDPGAA